MQYHVTVICKANNYYPGNLFSTSIHLLTFISLSINPGLINNHLFLLPTLVYVYNNIFIIINVIVFYLRTERRNGVSKNYYKSETAWRIDNE